MKIHFLLIGLISFTIFSCNRKSSAGAEVTATTSDPEQLLFQNPVLPGDFADPSVVRVGNDYWATATSSEWAPLFPLLHSVNLAEWEIKGNVFPDTLPDWAEAHFWAPEISFENGRYYIYYTAKKKGGNLCVGVASATEPTGPYTDHGPLVCQEAGSIDGFPFRDEKGELYLIWKEDGNSRGLPTPMWGQRMNEKRTQLLGDKFELFRNDPDTWEGNLVEGAYLLRRGNYYYAFYSGDACCGRGCTYGVGVARASNLKGPWEKYSENPILKQNEDWKCAGHGSLVSDPAGNDYFLYHAYSTNGTVYTGREGLLDKISWNEEGWPYFEDAAPGASAGTLQQENKNIRKSVSDEFTGGSLSPTWQWPVSKAPNFFNLSPAKDGQLILQASPDKIGNLLGQRTTSPAYTVSTEIDKGQLAEDTEAGLAAIGDQENAMGVAVKNDSLLLWTVRESKRNIIARALGPKSQTIRLRLTTENGNQIKFFWSTDGSDWNPMNEQALDASYLPPWDRAVRVGLTAKGPENSSAAFKWFTLSSN